MRVVFDARPLQSASANRGIGRYAFELLAALVRRRADIEFTFIHSPDRGLPRLPHEVQGGWLTYPRSVPEQLRGYVDAVFLPRLLSRVRADLYHSPEYGLPLGSSTPVAVSIHDMIPWAVPHVSYRRQRIRWGLQARLLPRADRLLCDSAHTRAQLLRRFPTAEGRSAVVYPGVSERFFERPSPSELASLDARIGGEFLLMVGETDWRKRPEHALAVLARSGGAQDLRLVVAGPNERHRARLLGLAGAAGVSDRLLLAGVLSDVELRAAYAAARALLFPSRYEGFGLPVLEAAAARLPVVAYANSALPEITGGSTPLVADGDLEAFVARALRVLAAGREGSDLEAARERARQFTWDRTAEQVLAVYETMSR